MLQTLREGGIAVDLKGEDLELSFYEENVGEEMVDWIRTHKEAIKEYIRTHRRPKGYAPIALAARQDSYPLSPAQYRMWLLSQLVGSSVAYNIQGQLPLHDDYDLDALSR
ncbi:MAG: hypothetical protein AAFV25_26020, partial [Bacteroidota bacterium]